jgi:hypothetical protein
VYTHAAPTLLSSLLPPTMAVFPSAETDTEMPWFGAAGQGGAAMTSIAISLGQLRVCSRLQIEKRMPLPPWMMDPLLPDGYERAAQALAKRPANVSTVVIDFLVRAFGTPVVLLLFVAVAAWVMAGFGLPSQRI